MFVLSHKHWPPGGWLYREKFGERWWNVADPKMPFTDVAAAICAQRKNNGITSTFKECVILLEDFTLQRMGTNRETMKESALVQALKRAEGCAGCGRKRK